MVTYIVRRGISMIVTFFLTSVVIFVILQLPPGDIMDFYMAQLSQEGIQQTAQLAAQLRAFYGLDQPLYIQYFKWVSHVLQANLGFSLLYKMPVNEIVRREIVWTLVVCSLSIFFTWLIGIPIGIYSAVHQYSVADYIFTFLGFLGLSIPNFFLALVLLFLLVVVFHSDITGGLFSPKYINAPWSWGKFIDLLKHLWIPVVVLSTGDTAAIIRIMRANLLDVLGQPYIQTARAKGLKERAVIYKHALRVAINPLISVAGASAPDLISGAVISGIVLSLPIIGPSYLTALETQDIQLAGSYLLLMVTLLLIGNFLADLALAWTDPRIRYD